MKYRPDKGSVATPLSEGMRALMPTPAVVVLAESEIGAVDYLIPVRVEVE